MKYFNQSLSAIVIILLFILASHTPLFAADSAISSKDEPLLNAEEVSQIITDRMKADNIHGVSVALIQNDRIIYQNSFGYLSAEHKQLVNADTQFQIGSLTKVFTATVLAQLQEAGLLNMQMPLKSFLPEPLNTLPIAERTLQSLSSHTSGLPPEPVNRMDLPDSPSVMRPYDYSQLLEALRKTPLIAEEGQRYRYSNFGFLTLGYVIEQVTGMPLSESFEKQLFEPLDMTRSSIGSTDNNAAAHHWPRQPDRIQKKWQFGEAWAHAGMSSTLNDMTAFIQWNIQKLKQGSPVQKKLFKMQYPSRPDYSEFITTGWFMKPDPQLGPMLFHDGNVDGNSAYIAILPNLQVGLVILANQGGVADEIAEMLLNHVSTPWRQSMSDARTAYAKGDRNSFKIQLDAMLKVNPESASFNFFKAESFIREGNCVQAMHALRLAEQGGVYNEWVQFYYSECAAEAGKRTLALKHLQTAWDMGFRDGDELKRAKAIAAFHDAEVVNKLRALMHDD